MSARGPARAATEVTREHTPVSTGGLPPRAGRRAGRSPAACPTSPPTRSRPSDRFLAYVVDGAVLGAVYGIGTAVALAAGAAAGPTPLAFLPLVLALLVGLGQWGAEAITGATVGGAALGIGRSPSDPASRRVCWRSCCATSSWRRGRWRASSVRS